MTVKKHIAIGGIALLGLSTLGCAATQTSAASAPPAHHDSAHGPSAAPATEGHDQAAHHDHDHAAAAAPAAAAGAVRGMIALPQTAGEGPKRQVTVLVDRPEMKLATIILRDGTDLPVHTAPDPVTIQVIKGAGMARVGDKEQRLDPSQLLLLNAEEPHSITPDKGTTMILLVHYIRAGEAKANANAEHTCEHHKGAH